MGISYRSYQEKIGGQKRQWRLEELVRFHNATGADFKVEVDGKYYAIVINELTDKPEI